MNLVITVMALLTAVVILAQRIVELKSAVMKYKQESRTPTEVKATLRDSKISGQGWPLILRVNWLMSMVIGTAYLLRFMWETEAATKGDVFMGAMVVCLILQPSIHMMRNE